MWRVIEGEKGERTVKEDRGWEVIGVERRRRGGEGIGYDRAEVLGEVKSSMRIPMMIQGCFETDWFLN